MKYTYSTEDLHPVETLVRDDEYEISLYSTNRKGWYIITPHPQINYVIYGRANADTALLLYKKACRAKAFICPTCLSIYKRRQNERTQSQDPSEAGEG